jgi:hypothetical protein
MGKYFLVGLYSVSLSLLLCASGCQVAGGGGMRYNPPENVICGHPWVISADFYIIPPDQKERYGKLTERYKDVTVYICNSRDSNFIAVPMVVESANPKTGDLRMKADMKLIPCDSGITYVEYYICSKLNGVYNRTKSYRVPIIKN